MRDAVKIFKDKNLTFDVFKAKIKSALQYTFWSRCEYEIIVAPFPPQDDLSDAVKIDVFAKVMMNFDLFAKYIWENIKG